MYNVKISTGSDLHLRNGAPLPKTVNLTTASCQISIQRYLPKRRDVSLPLFSSIVLTI